MVDFGNSRHDREAQPRTPGVRMIGASEPLAQFRKGGSRQAGPLVPDEDTGTRANRDNNRSASGRHAQGVFHQVRHRRHKRFPYSRNPEFTFDGNLATPSLPRPQRPTTVSHLPRNSRTENDTSRHRAAHPSPPLLPPP